VAAPGTGSASAITARSTKKTPSPLPSSSSVATCSARRVLPDPPPSVSVYEPRRLDELADLGELGPLAR
jgi:hypothetical protein